MQDDDPLGLPLMYYKVAQRVLCVGKSTLHLMLADGRLERVRLGARRCAVTTESVKRLIEGRTPLPPQKLPNPPRPPTPDNVRPDNGGTALTAPTAQPGATQSRSGRVKRPESASDISATMAGIAETLINRAAAFDPAKRSPPGRVKRPKGTAS